MVEIAIDRTADMSSLNEIPTRPSISPHETLFCLPRLSPKTHLLTQPLLTRSSALDLAEDLTTKIDHSVCDAYAPGVDYLPAPTNAWGIWIQGVEALTASRNVDAASVAREPAIGWEDNENENVKPYLIDLSPAEALDALAKMQYRNPNDLL
ncbi:hypothetical protein BDW69DRAFT_188424 [Aspergillus filifer]